MSFVRAITIALLAMFISQVQASCFTVYDDKGNIKYQAAKSPVSLARQIHDALPEKYPNSALVFDLNAPDCDTLEVIGLANNETKPKKNPDVALAVMAARYQSFDNATNANDSTHFISGSRRSTPGTDVQVSGYYRKSGVYVAAHTRSAPGRRR